MKLYPVLKILARVLRRIPILLAITLVLYTISLFSSNKDENLRFEYNAPQKTGIHLTVVACEGKNKKVLYEATTMIKSAVIFSDQVLNIHIFTGTLTDDFLKEEILHFIDSVIYVDADVIFLGPIEDIWKRFNEFDKIQVGGLAPRVGWDFHVSPNNPNFILRPNGKLTQVNSGVFLMNLTRLRRKVFRSDPSITNELREWNWRFLKPIYIKNKKDMHGDQNLINSVFHYNPELLYFLPCKYNYHHKFCFDKQQQRKCESAEISGAAVVHGSANTFYNNYSPAFGAVYKAFRQYNFEEDLEAYLLQPMTDYLTDPTVEKHEHCGEKTKLFTRHLRRSITSIGKRKYNRS